MDEGLSRVGLEVNHSLPGLTEGLDPIHLSRRSLTTDNCDEKFAEDTAARIQLFLLVALMVSILKIEFESSDGNNVTPFETVYRAW